MTEGGILLTARPDRAPPPGCVSDREAPSAAEPPRPDRSAEVFAGIRAVSPTERLVLRSVLEPAIEDSTLPTTVRVLPHEIDGELRGVRLYGVRRGSLLAALGFHNGDLVTSIAGHPLTGLQAVLETCARALRTDEFSVVVVRRGVQVELTFRPVDALPPEPGGRPGDGARLVRTSPMG